jgi:hypothetical protein
VLDASTYKIQHSTEYRSGCVPIPGPHGNTKYLDGLRDALFSIKKLIDSNDARANFELGRDWVSD